jgi:hypothetical protein
MRTKPNCAIAAIADAASIGRCGKTNAALQPKSQEQSFVVVANPTLQIEPSPVMIFDTCEGSRTN